MDFWLFILCFKLQSSKIQFFICLLKWFKLWPLRILSVPFWVPVKYHRVCVCVCVCVFVCCVSLNTSLLVGTTRWPSAILYVCMGAKSLQSYPTLCDPRTVTCQAPLSMGFSRQEYWSGLPFLSPGELPHPGIEPLTPALAGRYLRAYIK